VVPIRASRDTQARRRGALSLARSTFLAAVLLLASPRGLAQTPGGATDDDDPFDAPQFAFTAPTGPSAAPRLAFEELREIPLPGPLPGGARAVEGRVVVPTVLGDVVTAVEIAAVPDAVAEIPASTDGWVHRDDGSMRFRADEGRVVAEKRCRGCRRGWKRAWRLRAAGSELAPPLPVDDTLCYGAFDNLVQCVDARNGHRLWMVDVGSRVTRRLVAWHGELEPAPTSSHAENVADRRANEGEDASILLAITREGAELLALDAVRGVEVASVELTPAEGRFVGVPLAAADGRVIVARQWYRRDAASLVVYRLAHAEPDVPETHAGRTTRSVSPARTSAPSSQRIATTTARSGSPAPP
jgi:hypothetical protein